MSRDTSGAIMVAGTFMAVLLTAGVFYIIGTGDAIIYRERLQDSADAVAFTSAGVHARGMNLIVLINLVMAALLGVLIVLRLVIIMMSIAIVSCGVCIAATIYCPLSSTCASVMPQMIKFQTRLVQGANKYENILGYVLPALSGLQKVVAIASPWVGAYKGSKVAADYEPITTKAYVVSPSMIPMLPDGNKLGLPVEDMEYDAFCAKAATLAVMKGFGWTGRGELLGAFAGGVVKLFSGYFCGDDQAAMNEFTKQKLDDLIESSCEAQKKGCEESSNRKSDAPTCSGEPQADAGSNCVSKFCELGQFDTKSCVDSGKKLAKKNQTENGLGGGSPGSGGGSKLELNKTPKEIWRDAELGGFWFQTYAVTKGDVKWPRRNDKGLAIATRNGALPQVNAAWGNWRIAQAEFYFDDRGSWNELKTTCMWKMGWRARLRRLDPSELTARDGAEQVQTRMLELLEKKLGNWLGEKGGNAITATALSAAFKKLDRELTKLLGESDELGDAAPSWELVH